AGTKESVFYRRAYQALTDVMEREWPARAPNLPFNSAYEALVAASIVEKETGVASERPLIAAAIANRLRKGMPLQMDPTVIYGMGAEFQGN
ncbi:MAG TPA: endolytic transglycosylase MltG, partial [Thiotrichales bacterium]|nr:endolytic transglycosylase MltG [Thiotrichales bacterium]